MTVRDSDDDSDTGLTWVQLGKRATPGVLVGVINDNGRQTMEKRIDWPGLLMLVYVFAVFMVGVLTLGPGF